VAGLASANTKLLKLDVADTTLVAAVLELVGLGEAELLSDHVVANVVLWIRRQVVILLFSKNFLHGFVHFCWLDHRCRS